MPMKFVNTSEHVIILDAIGLPPVAPKGTIEIPDEICAPGRTHAGQRSKSPIECVAPQLVPATDEDRAAWVMTPPPPEPVSKIVTIAKRAPEEPEGVRALRELRAKQQAEAKVKAKVEAEKLKTSK